MAMKPPPYITLIWVSRQVIIASGTSDYGVREKP